MLKIILFVLSGTIVGFLSLSIFYGDVDDSGWKYASIGALFGLATAFFPLKDSKPPNMKIRSKVAFSLFILSAVLALVCLWGAAQLDEMEALGPIIFGLPFCGLLVLLGILLSIQKISTRIIIFWSSIMTATALILLRILC